LATLCIKGLNKKAATDENQSKQKYGHNGDNVKKTRLHMTCNRVAATKRLTFSFKKQLITDDYILLSILNNTVDSLTSNNIT